MGLIEYEECESPINFYFPNAVYEKGAEKKALLVDLLKRNITGLGSCQRMKSCLLETTAMTVKDQVGNPD